MLLTVDEPVLSQLIASAAATNASVHNLTEEQFARVVRDRIALAKSVSEETLRPEEYSRLRGDEKTPEFQVSQEPVPESIDPFVSGLARVERLREVRALTAFKRIYQPASLEDPGRGSFGPLSLTPLPWLPAIEVRGEGIFVTLREDTIRAWLADSRVGERAARVDQAHSEHFAHQHGEASGRQAITPEYLLLHSLAHSVIKRLSFECGYDVASLRERIYVSKQPWMSGFLIYTSTSDADGTLGGLERQGKGERFEATLRSAIQDCVWCSSDPLCRSGVSSLSESLNLAACHSCLLLPETCCELGNRFLDRGMLVSDGTAGEPAGFFDALAQL
jgi:hypothetical protein